MSDAESVVKVARDLTEITRLDAELERQAIALACAQVDGTSLPGGSAMVALGPVANLEAWTNMQQATERHGRGYVSTEDEDPDEAWPAFQLLEFWSEVWRREHDMEFEPTPHRPRATIASEANFLRWALNWAWDNEPQWQDFADDVHTARTKLEDILSEGDRAERGVPCLTCGVDLIRPTAHRRTIRNCEGHEGVCHLPHDHCPHDRGGLRDEWVCPDCERRYDAESYRRAVSHAHFVAAEWLPVEDCEARTGVAAGTVKVWATRGHVARRKDLDSGRTTYRVADIETRAGEGVA